MTITTISDQNLYKSQFRSDAIVRTSSHCPHFSPMALPKDVLPSTSSKADVQARTKCHHVFVYCKLTLLMGRVSQHYLTSSISLVLTLRFVFSRPLVLCCASSPRICFPHFFWHACTSNSVFPCCNATRYLVHRHCPSLRDSPPLSFLASYSSRSRSVFHFLTKIGLSYPRPLHHPFLHHLEVPIPVLWYIS